MPLTHSWPSLEDASPVYTTEAHAPFSRSKHIAKERFGVADAPPLHAAAGLVAGLVGTTVSQPLDTIRTTVFSTRCTVVAAASTILRSRGLAGFWRGWVPAYVRLGPIMVFFPAVLEQVRSRVFGLGYLV